MPACTAGLKLQQKIADPQPVEATNRGVDRYWFVHVCLRPKQLTQNLCSCRYCPADNHTKKSQQLKPSYTTVNCIDHRSTAPEIVDCPGGFHSMYMCIQCTHCTRSLACVPTLLLACCLKVCLEELNSLLQDALLGASPMRNSSNVGLNLAPADTQQPVQPK